MATLRPSGTEEERDSPPRHSRSCSVRFGARWRARRRTIRCCLSGRFAANTARTPPGPHRFAVTTATCSQASWRSVMRQSA
jgi:hypothetical protein